MKSINLCGSPLYGIAISSVLDTDTDPDHVVHVRTERDPQQYTWTKHVRFVDAKSGVVIGELLNVYHEDSAC